MPTIYKTHVPSGRRTRTRVTGAGATSVRGCISPETALVSARLAALMIIQGAGTTESRTISRCLTVRPTGVGVISARACTSPGIVPGSVPLVLPTITPEAVITIWCTTAGTSPANRTGVGAINARASISPGTAPVCARLAEVTITRGAATTSCGTTKNGLMAASPRAQTTCRRCRQIARLRTAISRSLDPTRTEKLATPLEIAPRESAVVNQRTLKETHVRVRTNLLIAHREWQIADA